MHMWTLSVIRTFGKKFRFKVRGSTKARQGFGFTSEVLINTKKDRVMVLQKISFQDFPQLNNVSIVRNYKFFMNGLCEFFNVLDMRKCNWILKLRAKNISKTVGVLHKLLGSGFGSFCQRNRGSVLFGLVQITEVLFKTLQNMLWYTYFIFDFRLHIITIHWTEVVNCVATHAGQYRPFSITNRNFTNNTCCHFI